MPKMMPSNGRQTITGHPLRGVDQLEQGSRLGESNPQTYALRGFLSPGTWCATRPSVHVASPTVHTQSDRRPPFRATNRATLPPQWKTERSGGSPVLHSTMASRLSERLI